MDGLQTVSCIGQSPPYDHRHGVIDVGIFHLGVEGVVEDVATRCDGLFCLLFGVFVFRCQGWSPPLRGVR